MPNVNEDKHWAKIAGRFPAHTTESKCEMNPQRTGSILDQIECSYQKLRSVIDMPESNTAGSPADAYCLLHVYEGDQGISEDPDVPPMMVLAIQEGFLLDYVKAGYSQYKNPEEFFSSQPVDIPILQSVAEAHGAIAFTYEPGADESFTFFQNASPKAFPAFADFLSGLLNDNGHTEASKMLDCLFDF